MSTTVSNSASASPALPALSVKYRLNLAEVAPVSYDGKFKEFTPHSSVGFLNLIKRTRSAEHELLSFVVSLSAAAAFSGMHVCGGWFPQDVGEPENVSELLDSPASFQASVRAGSSFSFDCPFDAFVARSVNYDPEIGGRPTFFCSFTWFNDAPYVAAGANFAQPAPDAKLKHMRVGFEGSVKVSALTSAIFA